MWSTLLAQEIRKRGEPSKATALPQTSDFRGWQRILNVYRKIKSCWLSYFFWPCVLSWTPLQAREETRAVFLYVWRCVLHKHLWVYGWFWHWNIDFKVKWVMGNRAWVTILRRGSIVCVWQTKALAVFLPTQSLKMSVKTVSLMPEWVCSANTR